MNAAELLEEFDPWPQEEMLGIGEQHLRAACQEIFSALRADRRVSADGHERRCEHFVVLRAKASSASS